MRLIDRIIALVLALTSLLSLSVCAEEQPVQQSPLLDAAFSMLEAGNPILEAYNGVTGAGVAPYYEYGLPYLAGGAYDDKADGQPLLFARTPEYAAAVCTAKDEFYRRNRTYLFGLDGEGYTQWIFSEAGWPRHDTLSAMITEYGKYGKKNHVYSHRKGKEMPPYEELAETLQLGDLLVAKEGARHVMMFIGTLRDYGFTAETAPELAEYLDYTLVIHSGPNPDYGARMQQYLDEHADDPYYDNVNIPNGGVCVSIIGVPAEDAPHQVEDSNNLYHYFDLNGYKITIWDLEAATSFCWFRIHGI